ncbi:MAG: hypothetical protein AAF646_06420 [Pseudomonadota bacterium]
MREFFIRILEKITGVIVALSAAAVIVAALAAIGEGGIAGALLVLAFGLIYVVVLGGLMYLGLGIYHNTKRTAEAMEAMSAAPRQG